MKLVPVESGHLKAVGYDERTGELQVEFQYGAIYSYANVPPGIHASLMAAKSVGGYFNRYVKGSFNYEVVRSQRPRSKD